MARVLISVLLTPGKCWLGETSAWRRSQILSGFGGSNFHRKGTCCIKKTKKAESRFDSKIARALICLRRSLSPTSLLLNIAALCVDYLVYS